MEKQRGGTFDASFILLAIGLTNQRETTIVWDAENGKALAPAIVWHDTRTSELVDVFIGKTSQKSAYAFQVHEETFFPNLDLISSNWFPFLPSLSHSLSLSLSLL